MTRTPLPIQADLADIEAFCRYLITKPAGVTSAEVINEKSLDGRKLSALKFWGLIEDTGTGLRLSERGLLVARDNEANRVAALREVVASTTPYASVIARAVQNNEMTVRSGEVAAHWHQRFRAYTQFGFLNYQVVCFFRVAEGADLGRLVVGRKGHQTRFELSEDDARALIDRADIATSQWTEGVDDGPDADETEARDHDGLKPRVRRRGNRVFITHRRTNGKIVEQVKELVAFGKFAPVVARDRETAKPSPHDMMDEMRGCDTAVIHVGGRSDEPRLGSDVLIEIGAAMALFGRNFILLVEDGVTLPANLQGLCECRYSGEELDMPATMTLFKAFNDFTRSRPTRSLVLPIGAGHVAPEVLRYERSGTPVYANN
jgi:Predicted nucleotide-binding protein containing TIR-like domain